MSFEQPNLDSAAAARHSWRSLYRTAGVCILISVVFIFLDISLTFTGGDVKVGGLGPVEWFAHFQKTPFVGLRNLGLFNVINTTLSIPLYLSLAYLHRKVLPAGAVLALSLFLLGAAVYDANNKALAMLSLSQQYASASSLAHKALIESAGAALLAQGEDFTPGTFLGLFISSLGSLAMMVVLLHGRVFSRGLALAGLVGTACLLVFTILSTFMPPLFQLAMILAMLGGLLMLGWNIAIAMSLFHQGRPARTGQQNLATA